MTDTIEALKAAAADLTARVAAFEKARVEEEGPPALTDGRICALLEGYFTVDDAIHAGQRLRYCERELARLREGLRRQEGDMADSMLPSWVDAGIVMRQDIHNVRSLAREIQRHRALLKDGGGK